MVVRRTCTWVGPVFFALEFRFVCMPSRRLCALDVPVARRAGSERCGVCAWFGTWRPGRFCDDQLLVRCVRFFLDHCRFGMLRRNPGAGAGRWHCHRPFRLAHLFKRKRGRGPVLRIGDSSNCFLSHYYLLALRVVFWLGSPPARALWSSRVWHLKGFSWC